MAKADAIRRAMALHRSGRFDAAAKIYRAVLAAAPDDVDALHLLGVLLSAQQQSSAGIELIRRALALAPNFASAHNNLGTALLAETRAEEALVAFQRAIDLKPDFAEAHSNRGNALAQLDRLEAAVDSHRHAIAHKPDYAEAHNNLGNALIALGRWTEAIEACRHAVKLRPTYAKAHNNLAVALGKLHHYDAACESFRQALAASPDFVDAHRGLAEMLMATDRHQEAIAALERVVALRPEMAEAHNSLGRALSALEHTAAAAASYRRAIALEPDHGPAHHNLGNALLAAGSLDQAAASYHRAAELMPEDCHALLHYVQVANAMCAWDSAAPAVEETLERLRLGRCNGPPLPLLGVSDDPDLNLKAAHAFVEATIGRDHAPLWQGEAYQHARIRLAYFSCHLREHPAARLIVDLIERHDRSQFEVIAVSSGPDDSSQLRRRIAAGCDQFVDVEALSDLAIAQRLRALEVDIVIDLDGHTEGSRSRALAWRPAPAQVAYLGYPASLAAPYIDYAIVDHVLVPDRHRSGYSEHLVYLPDSFLPSDGRRWSPPRPRARSAHGLPEAGVVLCCFNGAHKITAPVFDIWMRLLQAVPGSVLWLMADNRWAEANLKSAAGKQGVDPQRLRFAPPAAHRDGLGRLPAADLCLDTFPYNGGATSNDALWCGLPLITCCGRGFASRMGASLLGAIGMPELVTTSLAEYEALALELARAPERLAQLSGALVANKVHLPLFDGERFRQHLEAAYSEMSRASRAGEPPSSFAIEPASSSAPVTPP